MNARAAALVLALLCGSAVAEEARVVAPESLSYRADPAVPGATIAIVAGDPQQGPYTLRAKLARGARTPPHSHPDTRHVTVLSGVYHFASGPSHDEKHADERLQGYGPGTVIVVPAGVVHYSAAPQGEVVVQESGTGPTGFILEKAAVRK